MYYCSNIDDLFEPLGTDHDPTQCILLINSSTASLKAVLLRIRGEMPSVLFIEEGETYDAKELIMLLTYNLTTIGAFVEI